MSACQQEALEQQHSCKLDTISSALSTSCDHHVVLLSSSDVSSAHAPWASCRLFSRDAFADFITWLQFERPEELSILIHPLTEQLVGAVFWFFIARHLVCTITACRSAPCSSSISGQTTMHSQCWGWLTEQR